MNELTAHRMRAGAQKVLYLCALLKGYGNTMTTSMTKKTLALLDAVSNASLKDQDGLAESIKKLGLTGPELNELRRVRVAECLDEMNALCDEIVQLRTALAAEDALVSPAGHPDGSPLPLS